MTKCFSFESKEPTKIEFTPFCPVKFAARYKKCLPSGRNTGQRWLCSPRLVSGSLIRVVAPPDADTRYRPRPGPSVASGVKTITPSLFQVPPRPEGASQSVCTEPPATSSFFSFPSAKKARVLPSGDQNGYVAPSVSPSTLVPCDPTSYVQMAFFRADSRYATT